MIREFKSVGPLSTLILNHLSNQFKASPLKIAPAEIRLMLSALITTPSFLLGVQTHSKRLYGPTLKRALFAPVANYSFGTNDAKQSQKLKDFNKEFQRFKKQTQFRRDQYSTSSTSSGYSSNESGTMQTRGAFYSQKQSNHQDHQAKWQVSAMEIF